MSGGVQLQEAGIHHALRRRFVTYVVSLAMLTALGLVAFGGVRGTEAWGWFAFAALAGVVGAAAAVRGIVGRYAGTPASASARQPASEAPTKSLRRELSSPDADDIDDVDDVDRIDYLTALRHEFRTPLNAVLGFSDVLLGGIDGDVNASQREDLEIIRASGIRLRVLLDGALDLSQLAEGALHLDTDRTDVRELVARVAEEAGQLWSSKREATCTLPDAPCLIEADETRLRRSLLVLADSLASEHREAAVSVHLTSSNGHLAIEIRAEPSSGMSLDALPTADEVLASHDETEIRRWPIVVTSEVIARHDGKLYRGDEPCRFMIRLPGGVAS